MTIKRRKESFFVKVIDNKMRMVYNVNMIDGSGGGKAMRILRMTAKLTQQDVARALGIRRSTVAMWERGTAMPRADKLPELAKLYGCSIDDLFGRNEKEK